MLYNAKVLSKLIRENERRMMLSVKNMTISSESWLQLQNGIFSFIPQTGFLARVGIHSIFVLSRLLWKKVRRMKRSCVKMWSGWWRLLLGYWKIGWMLRISRQWKNNGFRDFLKRNNRVRRATVCMELHD